jgi:hypothetical protein
MDMSPPTAEEIDTYPHVIFTSDMTWDPHVIDDEYLVSDLDISEDTMPFPEYHPDTLNSFGDVHAAFASKLDIFVNLNNVPHFAFLPMVRIQHMLDHTTQFAHLDTRLPLRKHYKSPFPVANVSRLNEVVATITFFFDTPALDDGIMGHGGTTMLQLFCGCKSILTVVYPIQSENNIAGTLEEFIHHYGAPNALFTTLRHRLVALFRKSFACMRLRTFNVNHTTSTRTKPNNIFRKLRN